MPFLAALLPAIIGGGAALIGASMQKKSADAQLAEQRTTNAKVDEYGRPYREAGTNALSMLETNYGMGDPTTLDARRSDLSKGFESSPLYRYVYQPAVDEATKSYDRFASASGQLNSGRTVKAIQDRAAKIGGSTFGDYITGIQGIANNGQNAAFNSGNQQQQGTTNVNNIMQGGADARTAGVLGAGSAFTGSINNYNYLKGLSAYNSPLTGYPGSPGRSGSLDEYQNARMGLRG